MTIYILHDGTMLLAEEGPNQPDPLRVTLTLSVVVRRWGTTRGRGELAIDGPTENTVVDPEPPGGRVNWSFVRRTIPVTEKARAAWLTYLSGKI